MNKQFSAFLPLIFIVYFIIVVGANSILNINEPSFNFADILLAGLASSVVFTTLYGFLIYLEINPKIRFLKSDNVITPKFGSKTEITHQMRSDSFSFDIITDRIQSKFALDFNDPENKTIKFHTKFSIQQWPLGCLIHIDKENLATIVCFPFSGGFTKRASHKTKEFCEEIKNGILS